MRSNEIAAAIANLPPETFERFAVALIRRTLFPGLVPTSDSGDLGEDAKTEITTLHLNDGKWVSLQASKTATHTKLRMVCERCKSTNRQIQVLVFAVAKTPTEKTIAGWKTKVRKEYDWELEVRTLKALTDFACEDQCATLVDEYLNIPPLGGDHTSQINSAIVNYTKRSLRKSPVLAGMSQTIHREEIAKVEDQLRLHPIIAVTGEAGSGKTVIAQMLTQKATDSHMPVLFINAQNIESLKTGLELRSAVGLQGDWPPKAIPAAMSVFARSG